MTPTYRCRTKCRTLAVRHVGVQDFASFQHPQGPTPKTIVRICARSAGSVTYTETIILGASVHPSRPSATEHAMRKRINFRGKRFCTVACVVLSVGCQSSDDSGRSQAPRPVSVLTLVESDPGRFARVTGTVASWKTDPLGFEVDGRVEFVIEPETNMAGQVYDKGGNLLTEGTLLARLDPTRYELFIFSMSS